MLTLSFISLWLSLFLFHYSCCCHFCCCCCCCCCGCCGFVVLVVLFVLFVVSLLFGCCSFVVIVIVPLFNVFWVHCCCHCSCFVVVSVVSVVVGLLCQKLVLGKMRKLETKKKFRSASDPRIGSDEFCNLIRSDELNNQSEVDTSANKKRIRSEKSDCPSDF